MNEFIEKEDIEGFAEENGEQEEEEKEEENQNENDSDLTSFSYSDCHKLLTSKNFYFKMNLFSHLIQVINRFNISFQNQSMESFKTKQEIENIF